MSSYSDLKKLLKNYAEHYPYTSDERERKKYHDAFLSKSTELLISSVIIDKYKSQSDTMLNELFWEFGFLGASGRIGKIVFDALDQVITTEGNKHYVPQLMNYIGDRLRENQKLTPAIEKWIWSAVTNGLSPSLLSLLAKFYTVAPKSQSEKIRNLLVDTMFLGDDDLDSWAALVITQEDIPLTKYEIKKLYKMYQKDFWNEVTSEMSVWFAKRKDQQVFTYVIKALKSGEAGKPWVEAAIEYNDSKSNQLLFQLIKDGNEVALERETEIRQLKS